jgi:very-short-patch-repair endonuclease
MKVEARQLRRASEAPMQSRRLILAERSRSMKHAPTVSEAALWRAIGTHRCLGVRFRRQVVIADRFIVDFLAPSVRLVVEVDGPVHAFKRGADARRDRVLTRLGYRVLRLPEQLVREGLQSS